MPGKERFPAPQEILRDATSALSGRPSRNERLSPPTPPLPKIILSSSETDHQGEAGKGWEPLLHPPFVPAKLSSRALCISPWPPKLGPTVLQTLGAASPRRRAASSPAVQPLAPPTGNPVVDLRADPIPFKVAPPVAGNGLQSLLRPFEEVAEAGQAAMATPGPGG